MFFRNGSNLEQVPNRPVLFAQRIYDRSIAISPNLSMVAERSRQNSFSSLRGPSGPKQSQFFKFKFERLLRLKPRKDGFGEWCSGLASLFKMAILMLHFAQSRFGP
jgi:hypothetical protein